MIVNRRQVLKYMAGAALTVIASEARASVVIRPNSALLAAIDTLGLSTEEKVQAIRDVAYQDDDPFAFLRELKAGDKDWFKALKEDAVREKLVGNISSQSRYLELLKQYAST